MTRKPLEISVIFILISSIHGFSSWQDYWDHWSTWQYQQSGRIFPHGEEYLDKSATNTERQSGLDPQISFPVTYFGRVYTSCFISVHGHVALSQTSPAETTWFRRGDWPNPLYPDLTDPPFIGVFYANTDFRPFDSTWEQSRLFYRVMHRTDGTDPESDINNGMLNMMQNHIRVSVLGADDVIAQHALQVTWYKVTFAGSVCKSESISSDNCYRNTYQLALVVTEDKRTYTIINYYNVTWVGSSDMGCDPQTGQFQPGCDPAKLGFNIGQARGFRQSAYSGTAELANIDTKGGSNVPGRFFYQIDGQSLVRGGCTNDTSLGGTWELQARSGFSGMFGGREIIVAGPCFLSSDDIICRFGQALSQGVAQGGIMRAMCVSPAQGRIGEEVLSVSIDGGYNFYFHTRFLIGYMGTVDRKVSVSPVSDNWLDPNSIQLNWNPDYLGDYEREIDIIVFGYRESLGGQVVLDNLGRLAASVGNTGSYSFNPRDVPCNVEECSSYDLGAIQLRIVNSFTRMYSDVVPLGWFNNIAMQNYYGSNWKTERCRRWNSDDVRDVTWKNSLCPCPCTLTEALADFARFQPDSHCDMNNMHATSCSLHQGAVHCVRSILITSQGSGTHCCYDSRGELMYSGDNVHGSTPDKAHPWGKAPYGNPPFIPSVSHWANDLIPYYLCCDYQPDSDFDCFNYFISLRLTTDCRDYNLPGFAGVFGDPHFRTFDGTPYTFNGHGEFWLLNTDPVEINGAMTSFGIQGRFQQVNYTEWNGAKVSVLTGLVLREEGKSTVELFMDHDQPFDKIAVSVDGQRLMFPHYDVSIQHFPDVMVINHDDISNPLRTNFTVAFRSGVGAQVAYKNGLLHAIVSVPPQVHNHVRGLFGDWNGDQTDDLTPRSGDPSVPSDDLSQVHEYGWTWATSETESYFTYVSRLTHAYYERRDFVPVLTWPSTGQGNCGEDLACNFDYQNTRDSAVADETLGAGARVAELQSIHNQGRRTCGWLNVLNSIKQSPISYYVGSTVKITGCRHGFTLEGTTEYRCVDGESGPYWTPDLNTRCIDNESLKERREMLAMAIGIPAGIIFCILIIGLIAAVCYCIKRRKLEKDRKEESYRGDMTANDEFLAEFHKVKGETKRPGVESRPPRPPYRSAVPPTDGQRSSQESLHARSRAESVEALPDRLAGRDSVDNLQLPTNKKAKKSRAPYAYPNQPPNNNGEKRRPYQYPKSKQVLTIDEIMSINKTNYNSDSMSDV